MIVLAAGETLAADASANNAVTYFITGMAFHTTTGVGTAISEIGEVTSTSGTIFTAAATHISFISDMEFTNNDAVDRTIEIFHGGTGTSNEIHPLTTLAENEKLMYSRSGWAKWPPAASSGSGSVATDAIWDAAGDLVQGTGANTAARLAIGTADQFLVVNAGATAAEWDTLSVTMSFPYKLDFQTAIFPAANAPAVTKRVSAGTGTPNFVTFDFDQTTDESIYFQFQLPLNWASGGGLRISWMGSAASTNSVVWAAAIGAISDGDVDTPLQHNTDTAVVVASPGDGTEARRLTNAFLDMAAELDGMAALDLIQLWFYRDPDHASDTYAADAELLALSFEYVSNATVTLS